MPRFSWCLLVTLLTCVAPAQAQESVVRTARLHLAADDAAAAAEVLAGTPAAQQPEGAFTLALAYQALARHGEAATTFAQADTTQPRVLAAWARSLESLGRDRDAYRLLRRAYRADSSAATIGLAFARMQSNLGDWSGAERVYMHLLARDSTNAYLLARLGYVAYRQEEMLDAVVYYEKALQHNPEDKSALLALTRVYLDINAPLSARRSVDRLIDYFAHDPDVWKRRGEIGIRLEAYPYAIEGYTRAVALGDTAAPTLRGLGAAYYLARDYPAADSVLGRAFAADSTDALNAYYLGMARFAREDYAGAHRYLARTTTLMDQALLADVHAQIGAVYAAQKADRDAIAAYRLARTLDAGRADFLYHLAILYDRYYRDPTAARDAFETFLHVADPQSLAERRRYAEERLHAMRAAAHMQESSQ